MEQMALSQSSNLVGVINNIIHHPVLHSNPNKLHLHKIKT
ncbi:unnamed protein product [Arabidopsis halleri]